MTEYSLLENDPLNCSIMQLYCSFKLGTVPLYCTFVFRHEYTFIIECEYMYKNLILFSVCLTPCLTGCVLLCVALTVWCSSVVERTTFSRAVKPSAAREWLKCLQPGVTTDRSAKVRNCCQTPICTSLQITDTTITDRGRKRQ